MSNVLRSIVLISMIVIAVTGCGQQSPADARTPIGPAAGNEAVIRRYVEAINSHDYDALRNVLAPDFKLQLGNDALDREQLVAIAQSTVASFPDFNHTIEDLFASGDRVVLRVTDRGTHQGEFFGVAATGRKIEIGQISIYRMVDGKIAEAWEQADLAGLLQQIRAPAPGAAAAEQPAPR